MDTIIEARENNIDFIKKTDLPKNVTWSTYYVDNMVNVNYFLTK